MGLRSWLTPVADDREQRKFVRLVRDTRMSFHPAPPPFEARVEAHPLLGWQMRVKQEMTGDGDDTPMFAAVGRLSRDGSHPVRHRF